MVCKAAKLSLAFVLHAHQPPAESPIRLRDAIERAYRPVLELLAANEWFRFTLHISGSLIEKLEMAAPELLELIAGMVHRNQLELLGGGYHEPLMPLIPSADRAGQILHMAGKLEGMFGIRPEGIWLAERFWEPSLVSDLSRLGVRYTLVDDHGLLLSGIDESRISGPFLTEYQADEMTVFPISKALRYLIPYTGPEECINSLKARAFSYPGSLWVFADDLEKFGAWPGTYHLVQEQRWFERFLELFRAESSWLSCTRLSEAVSEFPLMGTAYLSSVAYPELMSWSLSPQHRKDSWRSGNIRNFLVRFPEVNLLYRKMLAASRAVHSVADPPAEAVEQLWLSQNHSAYTFGWFGGVWLPHIRRHARMSAAQAEFSLHKGSS